MPVDVPAFGLSPHWLPPGKHAAVCLSVDDVHPASTARHGYDAGGDGDAGALGHLRWLMQRHPQLKATLFVTADWRSTGTPPAHRLLSQVPWIRDRVYLAPRLRKGTMRVGSYPVFVQYLNSFEGVEVALHGLSHCAKGRVPAAEFGGLSHTACRRVLEEMLATMESSGLRFARGMTPPAWNADHNLLQAMADAGFDYVASARDIWSEVRPDARTAMSGIPGLPLYQPCWLTDFGLAHIPSNFQATSDLARANAIMEIGGLLSIKAHVMKNALGHVALDGLDADYMTHLDDVLNHMEERLGDAIWWPTFAELAARTRPQGEGAGV